ncbi:Lrp/AsnC family transcriptional regulator [Candidatus Bathyarchaeota archaeon]|nr:Lrp/AsnC family transcriptional regulator [Candidatus Bathyarchaeota archaeon]
MPSANQLDDLDLQIVRLLQEDSRISYNKIADKLRISVGTAYNRVKRLEKMGVLRGYTALVDPVKVGYGTTAIIFIQAEGAHLVEVENEIAKNENAIAVYDITGDFDIAVIARFRDRAELNSFVKKILSMPHVRRTVTNVVLNVVKEDFRIKTL